MSRLTIGTAILLLVAAPAWATSIVDDKFVIADEVFDIERLSNGNVAWRTNASIGSIAATQAGLIFAGTDGKSLSVAAAEVGQTICLTNDYLTVADIGWPITSTFDKVILDLTQVAFTFTNNQWSRRGNWVHRIEQFAAHSNGWYNPNTVLFISVHAELSSSGLSNQTINDVAQKIRTEFPGVKLGAGYPTTGGAQGNLPTGFPSVFPSELDVIVTWDYNIADPRTPPYSDPSWPANPFYKYGKIVARLVDKNGDGAADQHIFFLVSGFNQTNPPSTGAASRIHQNTGLYFGTLLRRWCAFALKQLQFRNAGLIVWKYNNSYTCSPGTSCDQGNCVGPNLFQTGAKTTFQFEASMNPPNDGLIRAYQAVSNAVASGGSCWAP